MKEYLVSSTIHIAKTGEQIDYWEGYWTEAEDADKLIDGECLSLLDLIPEDETPYIYGSRVYYTRHGVEYYEQFGIDEEREIEQ